MGGILPISLIRQGILFDPQDLLDLETTQCYETVIAATGLDLILQGVKKKSRFGASVELNYVAMTISMVVRFVERIPTIKT